MCRELNSWLRVASTEAGGASGSGVEVDSAQAPSRITADVAARTEYLLCKGILLWRKVHVGSERSGKVGNTTPVYRTAQAEFAHRVSPSAKSRSPRSRHFELVRFRYDELHFPDREYSRRRTGRRFFDSARTCRDSRVHARWNSRHREGTRPR